MDGKRAFSEVIYGALSMLPRDAAPDHRRFMAVIQDLAAGYPSRKKFLMHNSDDRYLQICGRAMRADDAQLGRIAAEASAYLQQEFSSSREKADEMSEDMVRAFAAVGRGTVPSDISWGSGQRQAGPGADSGSAHAQDRTEIIDEDADQTDRARQNVSGAEKARAHRGTAAPADRRSSGTAGRGDAGAAGRGPDAAGRGTGGAGKPASGGSSRSSGAGRPASGGSSRSSGSGRMKTIAVILIIALLAGGWFYWDSQKDTASTDSGTGMETGAEGTSAEKTYYLRGIRFDLPSSCEQVRYFYSADRSADMRISTTYSEDGSTDIGVLAGDRKQRLEENGAEVLDTGKVRIGTGGNTVKGRYVESKKDGVWSYLLFLPAEVDGQTVEILIGGGQDNEENTAARILRDHMLEVLTPGTNENTSGSDCEVCGYRFPYGTLYESSTNFTYPLGLGDEIGISSINIDLIDNDGTKTPSQSMAGDFPLCDAKDGRTVTDSGSVYTVSPGEEKNFGSIEGSCYEYYYGESLWHYMAFCSDSRDQYIYSIDCDLIRDMDEQTVRASVDRFLGTISRL